jgi:Predicted transcriptional regulator
VGDIVRALEEWVVLKGCSLSKDTCASCVRVDSCPTKDVWEKAYKAMFEALDAYTLESLLKPAA